MSNQKIEISDICIELRKLSGSGVFEPHTTDACSQAAALLERMRELVLGGRDETNIVENLKQLLYEQGEG